MPKAGQELVRPDLTHTYAHRDVLTIRAEQRHHTDSQNVSMCVSEETKSRAGSKMNSRRIGVHICMSIQYKRKFSTLDQ